MDHCDVITLKMTSYVINFILQLFQLPYNEDLLRLICENSSSYMKVTPFFRVEIGPSEKSADIGKIREKKCTNNVNEILVKANKFQVSTISLSEVMTFFIWGWGYDSSPFSPRSNRVNLAWSLNPFIKLTDLSLLILISVSYIKVCSDSCSKPAETRCIYRKGLKLH